MLDFLTRWDLQEVLMEVWARHQVTAITVTHDVDEALLLADGVVMMTNGPRARVGKIVPLTLPRPCSRRLLLAHPEYYAIRQSALAFLEAGDQYQVQQPPGSQPVIQSIWRHICYSRPGKKQICTKMSRTCCYPSCRFIYISLCKIDE
jgi:nitrate/nitrite transport system ATP-binding protein